MCNLSLFKGKGTYFFLILHFHAHDIIIHVITITDRKITCSILVKAHMFVKTISRIFSVDI